MRSVILLAAVVLVLSSVAPAAVPTIPVQITDGDPAQGRSPLALRERWRVGGEDGELIFGRITGVAMHGGCAYVLDNQLCRVVVISPAGEHLRTLSREGDGPGELRQPTALVVLPDDLLGVGMGYPGKMVTMNLDGTPGATYYPVGEPAEGNLGLLMDLQYADGVLVASGGRLVLEGTTDSFTGRFLSVSADGLDDYERILERKTPIDPTGRIYDEAADYSIDTRFALGSGGTIFAAMSRDRYEISVFDRSGELLRVFGRDEEPRRRSRAEKDAIDPQIHVNHTDDHSQWKIADCDPSVSRVLYDHDRDEVWVLTPRGEHDQSDGILQTWDVFSPEGEYLRRVPLPLGDEMRDGTCYLVGGDQLVMVRGAGSSYHGTDGGDDLEEVETLEVICYDMR